MLDGFCDLSLGNAVILSYLFYTVISLHIYLDVFLNWTCVVYANFNSSIYGSFVKMGTGTEFKPKFTQGDKKYIIYQSYRRYAINKKDFGTSGR